MSNLAAKQNKTFFNIILILLMIVLTACQTSPLPSIRPTEEFYINDRPGVFLNSTKWTIYTYSSELYEDSREQEYVDNNISGAQVVVTSYIGQVGDFNSTELFNAWGIGENNMGLLIILFFSEENDEYLYQESVYEMGLGMMGYLSAFKMDELVTNYFNDPNIPAFDYDERLISLYFAVLEHLYLDVYNYTSYDYQSFRDQYQDNKYEYFGLLPSDYEKAPLPVWAWVIIIVGIIALGVFPGGYVLPYIFMGVRNSRGGGGRSGGYWFRR